MKARDVIRLPAIRNRMLSPALGRRGLRKLTKLLEQRSKALQVYQAFGLDKVSADLYPRRESKQND